MNGKTYFCYTNLTEKLWVHCCTLTFCIGLNCSVKCAARSLTLFVSAEPEMSAQY